MRAVQLQVNNRPAAFRRHHRRHMSQSIPQCIITVRLAGTARARTASLDTYVTASLYRIVDCRHTVNHVRVVTVRGLEFNCSSFSCSYFDDVTRSDVTTSLTSSVTMNVEIF